ncbi:hypothetical protein [Flavobacterium sp. 25HG05S-40]|uniref:hypothetical protein n=1 Tax=Flavobacterium sp. 25HG05S-40 TaxID=3458682 RepID=UPI004044CAAD
MKHIIYLIVFLTASISFAQENKHFGKWSGINNHGNTASIILDKNNFVVFIEQKETYGGENFTLKGKNYMYKYEIDYSKNPLQIDFVLSEKDTGVETHRVKSIIRFIDENTIEIRNNKDENSKRPKKFTGKTSEDTMLFKREES